MPLDVELLRAWFAAFPFGTEAYGLGLFALADERVRDTSGDPTHALAKAAERWVSVRAHGRSLDSLVQLRRDAWFSSENRDAPREHVGLATLLVGLARSVLDFDGMRFVLREDGHHHRPLECSEFASNAARFRWLSLLFPSDLLVAALCAERKLSPSNVDVRFGSKGLDSILSRQVAETHMHVNNGVDPRMLWLWWLDDLPSSRERKLHSSDPFAAPFGSIEAFADRCTAAAIVRPWLVRTFARGGDARAKEPREWEQLDEPSLPALIGRLLDGDDVSVAARARANLRRALGQRHMNRKLGARVRGRCASREVEDAAVRRGEPDEEFCFLVDGLSALLERERAEDFSPRSLSLPLRWFVQYLRLRVALFRFTTQEPGVAGLDWFVHWDNRLRALYPAEQRRRAVAHAFALHRRAVPLKAMEVRLVPPDTAQDGFDLFVRTLDAALDAVHEISPRDASRWVSSGCVLPEKRVTTAPCEIGVVLHFIKEPAKPARAKHEPALHGDLRDREGMRHRSWLRENFARADLIGKLLHRHPRLLLLVRGFDVAARELTMPSWPVIAVLDRARRSAQRACESVRKRHRELALEPPRVTCHVGEDFRRSIEGLRRVHELLRFGAIRANDRLGHALVLGDDVERRSREQPVVFQPAEERLDDLLWEFELYRSRELLDGDGRIPAIEGEIHRLVRDELRITGKPTVEALADARAARHDPALIRRCTQDGPSNALSSEHDLWTRLFLADRAVEERGQNPVRVEATPSETAFALRAQRWLRHVISSRQITVESNPSSNLLIGDYRRFAALPTFRMRPLPADPVDMPTLQLSINSDDPLTFATHVGREFEYMFAALLRAEVSTEHALQWIEGVRECGVRSRFTLEASSDAENLVQLRNELRPYTLLDRLPRAFER